MENNENQYTISEQNINNTTEEIDNLFILLNGTFLQKITILCFFISIPGLSLLAGNHNTVFILSISGIYITSLLFPGTFTTKSIVYFILAITVTVLWDAEFLFNPIATPFTVVVFIYGVIALKILDTILNFAKKKQSLGSVIIFCIFIFSLIMVIKEISHSREILSTDKTTVKFAIENSDGLICKKINDNKIKNKCFNDVGVATKNDSLCVEIISDAKLREECLTNVKKTDMETYVYDFTQNDDLNFICDNNIQLSVSFNSKHNLLRLSPVGDTSNIKQSDIDQFYTATYKQTVNSENTYEQPNIKIKLNGKYLNISNLSSTGPNNVDCMIISKDMYR